MFACVMQFLLDILLFETLECVWVNVLVPSVVTKEVNRIHMILHSAVQHMVMHALYEEDGDSENEEEEDDDDTGMGKKVKVVMNAADYLFISTKVAKVFPQLMESVIVLSYQTYMPGEIAKHWGAKSLLFDDREYSSNQEDKDKFQAIAAIYALFTKFLGLIVTFLLVPMMSRIPMGLQKIFLRVVQPFIIGGLAFLYYSIVTDLTYLIVTVVVITVVLVAIGWKIFLDQQTAHRIANMVASFSVNTRKDKKIKKKNKLVDSLAVREVSIQGEMKAFPAPRSHSSLSAESKSNHSEVDEDICGSVQSFSISSAATSLSHQHAYSHADNEFDEASDDNDAEGNTIIKGGLHSEEDVDEEDDTDLSRPIRGGSHATRSEVSSRNQSTDTSGFEDDVSCDSSDSSDDSVEGIDFTLFDN
jgi:hypothetical protein